MMHGDVATVDALLADDLTYAHSSGSLDSKARFMEKLVSGHYQFESISSDEVSVRVHGVVGSLTGTGQMRVQVREPPGQLALPVHHCLSQGPGALADGRHPTHAPARRVTPL